jgi:hypothetical protein
MLQGAFDYTLNLAGELWAMMWKPTEERRVGLVREMSVRSTRNEEGTMRASTNLKEPACLHT